MQLENNLGDRPSSAEEERELCSLMSKLEITTGQGDSKNSSSKRSTPYTRSATSHFGFKKRAHSAAPAPTKHQQQQIAAVAPSKPIGGVQKNAKATKEFQTKQGQNATVDNRIDDNNGNSGSLDSLTSPGRTTPRLAPPRKEAAGGTLRTNRFGFRQPVTTSHGPQPVRGPLGQLTNRVGDVTRTDTKVTSQAYQNTGNKCNNNNITSNTTEKQRPRSCEGQVQTITRQQTQIKLKATTVTNANDQQHQQQIYNQQNMINRQPQQQLNYPIRPTLTSGPVNNTGIVSSNAINATNTNTNTGYQDPNPTSRFTLHSSQLPRPQLAIRMDNAQRSKLAKQVVNNGVRRREQSACGRMQNVVVGNVETSDPARGYRGRPRNLEVVMTGAHGFEVRDADDSSIEELVLPLPKLPSAFSNAPAVPLSTGLVRERTGDLQRITSAHNNQNNTRELNSQGSTTSGSSSIASTSSNFGLRAQNGTIIDLLSRKPSNSSSEGFTYDDEEKANRDRDISEKTTQLSRDFSPPSSKNSSPGSKTSSNNWVLGCGGEELAPADALSLDSNSGSANNLSPDDLPKRNLCNTSLTRNTGLQALMTSSLLGSSGSAASNLLLRTAMENDPKFAAVAADSCLLDDETSPVDSLISSTSSATDSCGEDDADGVDIPTDKNKAVARKEKDAGKEKDQDSLADQEPPSNMLIGSISNPGTPTNASNSLSLSDGCKDYFDDEIADQPELVFDDKNVSTADGVSSSLQLLSVTENTLTGGQDAPNNLTHTLVGPRVQPLVNNRVVQTFNSQPSANLIQNAVLANSNHPSLNVSPSSLRHRRVGPNQLSRCGSLDTLSPCESIASDDLMLDFDHSMSSLESDRAESGHGSALHSLDETQIMNELAQQGGQVMKEWTTLLNARQLANGINGSQQNPAVQPPARTARLLQRARASPPPGVRRSGLRPPLHHGSPVHQAANGGTQEASEDGAWIDRSQHNAMLQDVVGIKTMLLKLKRVLHETETVSPFDRQLGSPRHSADSVLGTPSTAGGDSLEMADLRRQVVFLQSQLEDKERTVQLLQMQMTKYSHSGPNRSQGIANHRVQSTDGEEKPVNAATQTERLRPSITTTGPTTYQQLGEANGLLSASDSSDAGSERSRRRLADASRDQHADRSARHLCRRCRRDLARELDGDSAPCCRHKCYSSDSKSDDSQIRAPGRARKRSGSRSGSSRPELDPSGTGSSGRTVRAEGRSKSSPRPLGPADDANRRVPAAPKDNPCFRNGACDTVAVGSSLGTVNRVGGMRRTNV